MINLLGDLVQEVKVTESSEIAINNMITLMKNNDYTLNNIYPNGSNVILLFTKAVINDENLSVANE